MAVCGVTPIWINDGAEQDLRELSWVRGRCWVVWLDQLGALSPICCAYSAAAAISLG